MGSIDRVCTKQGEGHSECPLEPHRRGARVVNQAIETAMAEEASSQVFDRGVIGLDCLGSKPKANSYHMGDLRYNKISIS